MQGNNHDVTTAEGLVVDSRVEQVDWEQAKADLAADDFRVADRDIATIGPREGRDLFDPRIDFEPGEFGPTRERSIAGLKRVSKPGLRVYARKDNLPRVLGGLGVAIISTSSGLMTDKQAKKKGVGGEVLAYVW